MLGALFAAPAMFMGSTLRRFSTSFAALSNFKPELHSKGDVMIETTSLKSTTIALVLIIAGMAQASATEPTMREKMACRTDAQTLCSEFIGKAPQMRACLEQNKAKLSTPCRQVVEAHGG